MINVNLTNEERIKLIDETNNMIAECDELAMDLICLRKVLSSFSLIKKKSDKELYKAVESRIRIKSRRLICLREKIDVNKEILGLKVDKKKKKNKTL